jgi:hypothetical protein
MSRGLGLVLGHIILSKGTGYDFSTGVFNFRYVVTAARGISGDDFARRNQLGMQRNQNTSHLVALGENKNNQKYKLLVCGCLH